MTLAAHSEVKKGLKKLIGPPEDRTTCRNTLSFLSQGMADE